VISERELPAEPSRLWRVGSREILLDRPIVAGILNVTPDSFSDGGNFFSLEKALEHAAAMVAEGADIIDVGGESTRPGATVVDVDEEIRRTIPVIEELRQRFSEIVISIDTTKSAVAAAAIEAGAQVVNDVSAFRLDVEMGDIVRDSGAGVVLMHSRGGVEDMASYVHATYGGDVVKTVVDELGQRADSAIQSGIDQDRIALDPGFGFSKVSAQSRDLLSRLDMLVECGFPVMVGLSRKRFVTESMMSSNKSGTHSIKSDSLPLEDRDFGTAALNVVALMKGARIFRVHNLRATRMALAAAWPAVAGR
jgi:dihydropteroate synthase